MIKGITRFFEMIAHLPYFPRTPDIAPPAYAAKGNWLAMLSKRYNVEGMRVLEIGSRVVTGANCRPHFDKAEYTGFDIYEGPNVDIAGDIHHLSDYFEDGTKFDLIFCNAVFEHLYAPWLAAEQISGLLNVGGQVFVGTHFSWRSHERPWNFFQFSDMGLRALFNEGLGFRVLDCGMEHPMIGFYTRLTPAHMRYRKVKELYARSVILAEKTRDENDFRWEALDPNQIVGETRYPTPTERD